MILEQVIPFLLRLVHRTNYGATDEPHHSFDIPQVRQDQYGHGFTHPGVFIDADAIHRMRTNVVEGRQPWKDAYEAMMNHPYARITHAHPYEVVDCGPYSHPDVGCNEERSNAMAAYLNALSWAATRNEAHAERAVSIMNAWASVIKRHENSNAPLQTAWAAADWARAGEIILHTGAAWKKSDIQAFKDMLRLVYLPLVRNGSKNPNNWELVLMEASISIAVMLEDRSIFDRSIARFINSTSYYIYMKSDGPVPRGPPNIDEDTLLDYWWNGQKDFKEDGMAMEICRDRTHTSYGLASISHVAETARIQGRDLYAEDVGRRLRAGLEFHTKYDKKGGAVRVPWWLCNGTLKLHLEDVTEPGLSMFADNYDLPFTKKYTAAARPAKADTLFIGWETLTHARGVI